MDKTLERILELIPKKDTGEFEHGALKKFANSIGLKSGNLIADWMAGRSGSYKRYIHEIADKYDVSVEWLKGEIDEKSPKHAFVEANSGDEMDELLERLRSRPECRMLFKLADGATAEDVKKAVAIIEALRNTEGK